MIALFLGKLEPRKAGGQTDKLILLGFKIVLEPDHHENEF